MTMSTTFIGESRRRSRTWPNSGTMMKLCSALLYLSVLLCLVHPSHGYFYKESPVSDNDKQCFCEVSTPIRDDDDINKRLRDQFHVQLMKLDDETNHLNIISCSSRETSTTAVATWTRWTTLTTSRSIPGYSPCCGITTSGSTRQTSSKSVPSGQMTPSAP